MFWLGMLVMYIIVGIIISVSEAFGDGVLDEWLFWIFAWWINLLLLPFAMVYCKIKKSKKNNINRYKVK